MAFLSAFSKQNCFDAFFYCCAVSALLISVLKVLCVCVFTVLAMLKSLHQLQMENQRLEEQIRTLTMKKERLQLLSAQLSVPFTHTNNTTSSASSPLYQSNTHTG